MLSGLDSSPLGVAAAGFFPTGRFAGGAGGVGLDPAGRDANPFIPLATGVAGVGRDAIGGGGGGA